MFIIDGALHWSASDLTAAAECEYALLRTLDHKLGRIEKPDLAEDPLQEHIARLGDAHEERLLETMRVTRDVKEVEHITPPYTAEKVAAAREATLKAFADAPEVVFQAAFSDGEFFVG